MTITCLACWWNLSLIVWKPSTNLSITRNWGSRYTANLKFQSSSTPRTNWKKLQAPLKRWWWLATTRVRTYLELTIQVGTAFWWRQESPNMTPSMRRLMLATSCRALRNILKKMILCDYESSNGWLDYFDWYRRQSILFAPGKCKTCLLLKSCLIEFFLDIFGLLIFLGQLQTLF